MRLNFAIIVCATFAAGSGCDQTQYTSSTTGDSSNQVSTGNATVVASASQEKWLSLFDGKSLGDWTETKFGGQDTVNVQDGSLIIEMGYPLAGVTYGGEFPTDDYQIELKAKLIDGTDFFCCLTLPAGDEHFSFVVGGWGGTVTGISCVDQLDASENETRRVRKYEIDRWYTIRVAVGGSQIQCWIDDELMVDLNHTKRKLSLRNEVEPSKPVGICTFETRAAFKQIKILQQENSKSD